MKRTFFLIASAVMLFCNNAEAQLGKRGTQRPSTAPTQRGIDNRSQPGTWRTTPEERMNTHDRLDMENRRDHRDKDATPATIRTGQSVSGGSGQLPQDTIRARRDTVKGAVPPQVPDAAGK